MNRAFGEKFELDFPLLSDVDQSVGEAYLAKRRSGSQAPELPRRLTYLIGPDRKVAKAYKVTDVKDHPEEVLRDLRELSGKANA